MIRDSQTMEEDEKRDQELLEAEGKKTLYWLDHLLATTGGDEVQAGDLNLRDELSDKEKDTGRQKDKE